MISRFFFAFISTIALLSCQRPESTAPPATGAQNTSLAKYAATTLDGKPYSLRDNNASRVLLVNVWATWCGPCREEIPDLKKLQTRYSKRSFEVVGISVDTEDAIGTVRQFVAEQKINYPIVLDPGAKIMTELETMVLPTSILLDRSGKIVWKNIGLVEADDKKLVSAIEAAL